MPTSEVRVRKADPAEQQRADDLRAAHDDVQTKYADFMQRAAQAPLVERSRGFVDTFDSGSDIDDRLPPTNSTGQTWTRPQGGWTVTGGALEQSGAASSFAVIEAGLAETDLRSLVRAEMTPATDTGTANDYRSACLLVYYTDQSNYAYIRWDQDGEVLELRENDGSGTATVASSALAPDTLGETHIIYALRESKAGGGMTVTCGVEGYPMALNAELAGDGTLVGALGTGLGTKVHQISALGGNEGDQLKMQNALSTGGGGGGSASTSAAPPVHGSLEYYQVPAAVHYSGTYNKTYYGWISDTGEVCVRAYDHETGRFGGRAVVTDLRDEVPADKREEAIDDHNAPTLFFDDTGRLMVFYCVHDLINRFWVKRASYPEVIHAWEDAIELHDSGVDDVFNYPQPRRMASGDIALTYRRHGFTAGEWMLKTSSDEGATWSSPTLLADFTDKGAYMFSAAEGSEIHVLFHSVVPAEGNVRRDLYYMMSPDEGASWQTHDGTAITLPADTTDLDTVFAGDNVRALDLKVSGGEPYIGYCYETSPHRLRYAFHDGSSWVNEDITNGDLMPGGNFYSTGLAIDPSDPSRVAVTALRSGVTEIEIHERSGADSWGVAEQVTQGTAASMLNMRPQFVKDYAAGVRLVWMQGNYKGSPGGNWVGYQGVRIMLEPEA